MGPSMTCSAAARSPQFKTNDCLRHAERQLNAGVDSFLIVLRHCLCAMLHADDAALVAAGGRPMAGLRARLHRLRLRVALWLLQLYTEGTHAGRLVQLLAA